MPFRFCPGLEGVTALAAGGTERLALRADGSVLAWGSSPSDLSGTGGVLGPARWGFAPTPVEGLPGPVRVIAAGNHHSLALTSEGGVFAWGSGHLGPLGDGAGANRYPAVQVRGLGDGVRAIAAGYGSSYALLESGAVLSWGWNQDGKLGDGSVTRTTNNVATKRLKPGPVPALSEGVVAISELVALMGDGSVRAWGGEYQPDQDGADARLGLAATKLGGRPDLRARSRWPARNGRPLSFVAQLDLAQLAPLDRTGLLPSAGLLSFFHGTAAGPTDHDLCQVHLTEPGTPLKRRDFPDELPDHERYRAVPVTPEIELTLPPQPPSFLSEAERDAYQWELDESATEPRHRVLGHPDPVQNDPRRKSEAVLLQVDSDATARMMWGDVGRLYYLVSRDDLHTGSLEASRCELQSR